MALYQRPLARRIRSVPGSPGKPPMGSRVWSILNKPIEVAKPVTIPTPILNFDVYKSDLRRANQLLGIHDEATDATISNVPLLEDDEKVFTKKIIHEPNIVNFVHTKISANKNGSVNVSITAPIEKLYIDYYSKGTKPPLKDRVNAFKKVGYTEDELLMIVKKDEARENKIPELEEFIKRVFGNVSTKKDAPPKKKTLQQMFKFKSIKPVTCEEECAEVA